MKAIVDKLLTNVSSMFKPSGFQCESILPEVQSAQYSGLLGKYGTSHLRIENSVIGGQGKYRRVNTIVRSTQSYVIQGHGLEGMVTKNDYANVEAPFDAERDEAIGLSTVLFLEKEKALADTLGDTAILTQNTTLSGSSQWNDQVNSSPLRDAKVARLAIIDGCGEEPNLAVCDIKVAENLRFHPEMLDALGYKFARPGGLSDEELARALKVDRFLVARARYESAAEGQASALLPCWGKNFVFAVAPPTAGIMQTSLGYMLRLSGSAPRKTYKEAQFNPPGSTKLLVEDEYDMLISNANAGYLIKNAIA